MLFRRPDRAAWVVAAALFAAYSAMAVNRHHTMRTAGYDLGIFEQAVRAYAQLRAPIAELKGPAFNVLGDHFHPVLVLLAPFYRIFPGPITLLVTQGILLALSAVPVTRLAMEFLGRRAGVCIGLGYGLSWGIQQAAAFDFHEIAFAVPLVAYSMERLVHRRWSAAACWALPLLLVKEDQALILAAVGGYVLCAGSRRLGLLIVTVAVVTGFLTVFVIIPAFSPGQVYPYAKTASGSGMATLLTPMGVKGWTLLALVAPTLLLALRSPLLLIAVPYVAARFWTSNPAYWGTGFHYSAVLMPIVFIAALDGLRRLHTSKTAVTRVVRKSAPTAILAFALAVTMFGGLPLTRLLDAGDWQGTERFGPARDILDVIPDGADVATSNRLAPQLTRRCRVFRLIVPSPFWPLTEWVAVATSRPFPSPSPADAATIARLPQLGYRVVERGGGVVIYRRT
ncbi:DUF2079 domain-containing protein [Actinomadura rudentiformis]|uniref:DUF2079 domain-containing protein n=1 Tax=Actinomadura rudentiformis TaxID=359158 RepID=A0A6H9YAL8_9ACTN|nr:DUF2079 domain-containing protein [Actinomadura rudentiformis]KAB2340848.1 DUF2079 domain-containing protein [Actinomadura rudentiformis]